MKKYIFYLFIILVIWNSLYAATDKWNVAKSAHFIVYYKDASEDFISQLIENAEDYYEEIADNLGFRRYNFWLWENRATIYIYNNAQDYQTATGQPSWSSGCAAIKEKIIHTFPYAQGFFKTILPHEMGHIIFREFVGFDNQAIPLWLDEGVASYQESLRRPRANLAVKEAINKGTFVDLEKLSNLNPHSMSDSELVNLFYSESISVIDFLIKEFGSETFVFFCQNLRDKQDLNRSISSSYPFKNVEELDKAWQRYLKNE